MKGLLIKDCLLLKNIRKVFLFMILSACFCSLAMQDKNFIGGYLMVFFGTVCLSSISYDEMDQGNLTIFSFPMATTKISAFIVECFIAFYPFSASLVFLEVYRQ